MQDGVGGRSPRTGDYEVDVEASTCCPPTTETTLA
jgi:hypothetical protein